MLYLKAVQVSDFYLTSQWTLPNSQGSQRTLPVLWCWLLCAQLDTDPHSYWKRPLRMFHCRKHKDSVNVNGTMLTLQFRLSAASISTNNRISMEIWWETIINTHHVDLIIAIFWVGISRRTNCEHDVFSLLISTKCHGHRHTFVPERFVLASCQTDSTMLSIYRRRYPEDILKLFAKSPNAHWRKGRRHLE